MNTAHDACRVAFHPVELCTAGGGGGETGIVELEMLFVSGLLFLVC